MHSSFSCLHKPIAVIVSCEGFGDAGISDLVVPILQQL